MERGAEIMHPIRCSLKAKASELNLPHQFRVKSLFLLGLCRYFPYKIVSTDLYVIIIRHFDL